MANPPLHAHGPPKKSFIPKNVGVTSQQSNTASKNDIKSFSEQEIVFFNFKMGNNIGFGVFKSHLPVIAVLTKHTSSNHSI